MLTEDYFMRMINQALAVLMTALGFKRAGQLNEARQAFEQALEGLLGLDAHLVKQLDDSALLRMLTFQDELDIERLLVLAEIYREEAEVYALQGWAGGSQVMAQSSLRFYLEAALADETNPGVEVIRKIEALRGKLAAAALPVETRLALMDYLERMLAEEDDFLVAAGLSREEVRGAFSALEGMDVG